MNEVERKKIETTNKSTKQQRRKEAKTFIHL